MGIVTLLSPSGTIPNTLPTFNWDDSALQNIAYHFQLASDGSFEGIMEEATDLNSSNYTPTTVLSNGATYYCRLAVIDENGVEGSWSASFSLTIDLSTVALTSPSQGAYTNDTTPSFTWGANENAASYAFALSESSDLSNPVVNESGITDTSYALTSALSDTDSTTYYWAVTPVDTNGVLGTQSDTWSFTLDTTAPTGSITINSNDINTWSSTVTLNHSATDTSIITGYYASLNSTTPASDDVGWTDITPADSYSDNVSFTLSGDYGNKTVYVWFKDAAANLSEVRNDSINWRAFTARIITGGAENATSVYAIDVDGDGDVDVLSASHDDNKIAWYENE